MENPLQNRGKKLLRGSFLNTLGLVITIVVAFFMFPFLVHNLGDKTYGLWVLVMTFVDYYILLRMGFSEAVVRYLARSVGENDTREMSKISSTTFFIFLGIAILMLVFTGILFWGAELIVKNQSNLNLFQTLILILGINTAISPPLSVFGAILSAHMKYFVARLASIAALLLKNLLIFISVSRGGGLISIAWIYLICHLLASAFLICYVRKTYPSIKISLEYYRKEKFKTLFSFSFFTFIAQLADKLRYRVDTIVITAYIGLAAITHYNVGFRLINYFIMLIIAATGVFQTYISQEKGLGNYQSIRDKFMFVTKLSSFLSVFIGGSLIIYGKPFIRRWMGAEYTDSYSVLFILSISTIVFLAQFPTKTVLYGISKNKFWAYSNIIEGICNVILSLLLVKKLGLIGIALGTTIPMLIMKLIFQPIYISKILSIDLKKYYKHLAWNLFRPLFILFIFYLIVQNFLQPSYKTIFILAAIQAIVYLLVSFLLFFKKQEKDLIIEVLK